MWNCTYDISIIKNILYKSPNKILSIAVPARPRAQISVTVDDLTKDDRDRQRMNEEGRKGCEG